MPRLAPLVLPLAVALALASRLPTAQAAVPAPARAWTLGVLTGPSPFDLTTPPGLTNPVLRGAQVTDMPVDTLAHPFLVADSGRYFMFFTAKDAKLDKGGIGVAESADGLTWKFRRTVVRESFVLSHPCVIKWRDQYYMVPEAHTENSVRLYRATKFPDEWAFEATLLSGGAFISPTLVYFQGRWWMFTSPSGNQTLRLFFATDLKGPWQEHRRSPIVTNDAHSARPGGRPLILDGKLHRLAQDCAPTYGNQVRAFEITELSPTAYAERMIETPLVKKDPAGSWNLAAMHHVDALRLPTGRWLAVVDAQGRPID